MNVDEFDYNLPEELIAQTPLKDRSASKLLVLDKTTGKIEHKIFKDIINYLQKGDTLVLNNTKVLPARLIGEKVDTHAVIEVLLLKNIENDTWECLVKPARRVKEGTIISFGNNKLKAKCLSSADEGLKTFEFIYDGIFMEILDELGTMPLPPYIHEKLEDGNMYQTVYAKDYGSAAAPTAGLHFTDELLDKIKEKGVIIVPVTLHVGLGTFRPVMVDDVTNHKMHTESYIFPSESADILNKVRENGKKIFVVGTTSTRVLETNLSRYPKFTPEVSETDIFIYPGYEFKAVDNLITNFHLPKSTLVMLVSALAGKDNIMKAYKEAVDEKYRFFSFGDAMLIID
jgi:S-adenosylmethionine:tRNA ribosyltransferase-isomerase